MPQTDGGPVTSEGKCLDSVSEASVTETEPINSDVSPSMSPVTRSRRIRKPVVRFPD